MSLSRRTFLKSGLGGAVRRQGQGRDRARGHSIDQLPRTRAHRLARRGQARGGRLRAHRRRPV